MNILGTAKDNILKHMAICGEATEIVLHALKNSLNIQNEVAEGYSVQLSYIDKMQTG